MSDVMCDARIRTVRRPDSKNWYAEITLLSGPKEGKMIMRSLQTPDKQIATRRLANYEQDYNIVKPGRDGSEVGVTFDELVELYVNEKHDGWEGLPKDARPELRRLKLWFHLVDPGDMSADLMDAWVADQHPNSMPGTVARAARRIRAVLMYGVKRKRLSRADYQLIIEDWDFLKPVDDARCRWLDVPERDALIAEVPDMYRPILTLLFFTGLRLGEAKRLTLGDISPTGISTWSIKGGRRRYRVVPLPSRARLALQPAFSAVKGNQATKLFRFSDARLRLAMDEAKARLGIIDFRIHDCRHTYAVLMRIAGADIDEIARLLGHSNLQMAMRYNDIVPRRVGELAEKL